MKHIHTFFHHVFVPGKHNDHQAHATSPGALTLYALFAIALFTILPNLKYHSDQVLGFATDIRSEELLVATNARRTEARLSPLKKNSKLAAAAQAKAADMFNKNYWAHFGPSGETPWNFILDAGYDYEFAGENLAKNFMTSDGVVGAWMNSPTHRANIVNKNYTEVGFAVVDGTLNGEDTTLVVQMFGAVSGPTKTDEVSVSAPRADSASAQTEVLSESSTPATTDAARRRSTINLLPAYQFMSGVLLAFLITAFAVDLYHISRTDFHRHRGKHVAHLIFLLVAIIGIFFLSTGSIL